MKEITIFHNFETNEFFFSTDHCQTYKEDSVLYGNHKWTPCTSSLQLEVSKRTVAPDGVVDNIITYIQIFESTSKYIRNPDKKYKYEFEDLLFFNSGK